MKATWKEFFELYISSKIVSNLIEVTLLNSFNNVKLSLKKKNSTK